MVAPIDETVGRMSEYEVRLATIVKKSRGEAAFTCFLAAVFISVNIIVLHRSTTYTLIFGVLFSLQLVFGLRRMFRLRTRSPIIVALRAPTTLTRVHGWPYAKGKWPPGKVPQYVQATAGTAMVRLKVGDEREMRGFVAALRAEAPKLDIDVPNVPSLTSDAVVQ